MRVGIKLLDEATSTYRTFRMNVFHISKVVPIDDNDIDKGTHIVDIQGNVMISCDPIDVIEVAMQKVEAEAIAVMLQNIGIFVSGMNTKSKVKKSAPAAKKRVTKKR